MFPEELRASVDSLIRAVRAKDFGLHAFVLPALRVLLYLGESGLIGGKPTFGAGIDAPADPSSYADEDLAALLEDGLDDPARARRYGAAPAERVVGGGLPATIIAALLTRLLARALGASGK